MNARWLSFLAASCIFGLGLRALLASDAPSARPLVNLGSPTTIVAIGELMGADAIKAIAVIPGTGRETMNMPGGSRELVYEFDSSHSTMRFHSMGGRMSSAAWTIQFTDLETSAKLYNAIQLELANHGYKVTRGATKVGRSLVSGNYEDLLAISPKMVVIGAQSRPQTRSIVFDVSLAILVGDTSGLPNIQVEVDVLPDLEN